MAFGALAVWLAIAAGLHFAVPRVQALIRDHAAAMLGDEFGRPVQIQSLQASASFTRLHIVARGIEIGGLARIETADAQTGILPWHVRSVVLDGLSVRLTQNSNPATAAKHAIAIDEVTVRDASVQILEVRLQLASLRLRDFDPRHASAFSASVLMPQPQTIIAAQGRIGPWKNEDPTLTPVDATYAVQNSNLATVPGLSGTLSSRGRIRGALRRPRITGDAAISAFGLGAGGRGQPVQAQFDAAVDVSDGTAAIETLHGSLADSSFNANGTVRNIEDDSRREMDFQVSIPQGRLQDVLPLAVKSKTSPLSGALQARAMVSVLPGAQDILKRIYIAAAFTAADARFASLDLRERLRALSRKAEGRPQDPSAGSSRLTMEGSVEVADGVAQFSKLNLQLEGSSASLRGSYQLGSESLDFTGEAELEAKLSQTATGAKAALLKLVQPFFRSRTGGARLPVRITGTREDPQFGLSLATKVAEAGRAVR